MALGLLETAGNEIAPSRGEVSVEDALWAGNVEPRVLELLPPDPRCSMHLR